MVSNHQLPGWEPGALPLKLRALPTPFPLQVVGFIRHLLFMVVPLPRHGNPHASVDGGGLAWHLHDKPNARFVVTSLPETVFPWIVYERVYCPQGNAENALLR